MSKHIGNIIQKVLEGNNVTPEEFAEAMGKDVASVYEIFDSATLDVELYNELLKSVKGLLDLKHEELSRKEQELNKKIKELDDEIANNSNLLRAHWN